MVCSGQLVGAVIKDRKGCGGVGSVLDAVTGTPRLEGLSGLLGTSS